MYGRNSYTVIPRCSQGDGVLEYWSIGLRGQRGALRTNLCASAFAPSGQSRPWRCPNTPPLHDSIARCRPVTRVRRQCSARLRTPQVAARQRQDRLCRGMLGWTGPQQGGRSPAEASRQGNAQRSTLNVERRGDLAFHLALDVKSWELRVRYCRGVSLQESHPSGRTPGFIGEETRPHRPCGGGAKTGG